MNKSNDQQATVIFFARNGTTVFGRSESKFAHQAVSS